MSSIALTAPSLTIWLGRAPRSVRRWCGLDSALQESKRAPFFRAPMLQLSPQTTRHIASLGMMIWSHDVDSRDWSDSSEEQGIAQIMRGLDKAGRGIVTMQDMQPKTARALPLLLEQLKRRNYMWSQIPPRWSQLRGSRVSVSGSRWPHFSYLSGWARSWVECVVEL
jgi:peptidoglycan/xylan/chitin deacetylase (PgdA/CDA1 family)